MVLLSYTARDGPAAYTLVQSYAPKFRQIWEQSPRSWPRVIRPGPFQILPNIFPYPKLGSLSRAGLPKVTLAGRRMGGLATREVPLA
jgi:hypothetical protein